MNKNLLNLLALISLLTTLAVSIYGIKSGSFVTVSDAAGGDSWYVSTNGTSAGNGSLSKPWDLQSVISGSKSGSIKAGDTVYIRAGVYGNGGNICGDNYDIDIGGSSNNYLTIRSYPGEIATINEGIVTNKPWLILRDLRFTNTDTNRYTSLTGSNHCSGYTRNTAIRVESADVKLVNNFVDNAGGGIAGQQYADGLVIYGNLVQNNGWVAPDRFHGHGIYLQNTGSVKKIVNNNIIMPGLDDTNMHLYGSDGLIDNISMENNIFYSKRWLMQTEGLSMNLLMKNNYLWNGYLMAGYISDTGYGMQIDGNYFGGDGGSAPSQILYLKANLKKFNIVNNTFCFTGTDYFMIDEAGYKSDSSHYFDNNKICTKNRVILNKTTTVTYDSWKSSSGFNKNESTISANTNKVVVIPNAYEEKRGHIAIYNWQNLNTVNVDISSLGYSVGDVYKIYNAANYFGDTPITGTYNGSPVAIDMRFNRWTLAKPNGGYPSGSYNPGNPYPKFGAFIIRSSETAIDPITTPIITSPVSPTSGIKPTNTPTPPQATNKPTTTPTSPPISKDGSSCINTIKNPGFEDGETNWSMLNSGEASHTVGSISYSGNKGKEIVFNKDSVNEELYQTNISLKPNTKYIFRFWAKANRKTNTLVLMNKQTSASNNYGLGAVFSITNNWKRYSVKFTTSGFSSTVNDAKLRFSFSGYAKNGDQYYFDDITLIEI